MPAKIFETAPTLSSILSFAKKLNVQTTIRMPSSKISKSPCCMSCQPVVPPCSSGNQGRKNKIRTARFIPKAVFAKFIKFFLIVRKIKGPKHPKRNKSPDYPKQGSFHACLVYALPKIKSKDLGLCVPKMIV